jgi:3-oxoisoapionate decarboxylase
MIRGAVQPKPSVPMPSPTMPVPTMPVPTMPVPLPDTLPSFVCAAWGWREYEMPAYFDAAVALGLPLVELNAHPQAPKHLSHEPDPRALPAVRRWAADAGASLLCVAGRNDFATADPAARHEHLRNAHWFIDAAAELGAPFVRLLSGGHRDDTPDDATFSRLHAAFNEVGAHAEQAGVAVVIENHGGPTATGQRVARLMAGIESPAVGLNYDPANFLNQGTDPLMALRWTRQWVRYSHWKDVRWGCGGPAFCAFGDGEIQWRPIVDLLLGTGYRGWFGIEYEEPRDVRAGTERSLASLRALLAEVLPA